MVFFGRRCRLHSPVSVAVVAVVGVVVVAVVALGRPAAAADAPDHDAHHGEFDYYREWGDDHLAANHAPDGNDDNAKTVHDDYESFVEGVENVMTDQRAASSKRDVVDLGQSLHLLDSKFEHLKQGLYEQIAAAASRKGNKASVAAEGRALAQKVKTKYTNLRTVAREVLDILAKNARAVDQVGDTMTGLEKVVVELQKHLEKHHNEVIELGSSVKRLHDSSHVLMETHSSATDAAMSATKKATKALNSASMPSASKVYYLLLVEMAGLCAFALYRRRRSRVKYSAKLY